MVKTNAYLLLGPQTQEKEEYLGRIKKDFACDKFKDFNTDRFSAEELTSQILRESLLRLPLKNTKRLVTITNIERLSSKNKDTLLAFLKKSVPDIVLVLESRLGLAADKKKPDEKQQFLQSLKGLCRLLATSVPLANAFSLARLIDARSTPQALGVLTELFRRGEKPEMILGGLRFHWSRGYLAPSERKARLRLLLDADMAIKSSFLKDTLALELMVVKLCRL